MLIALALPRSTRATRRRYYPYSPLYLAAFDAVVLRACTPTLQLPTHATYLLDTRWGAHARSEVILRAHGAHIAAVIAASRFPHGVRRLKPLLTMPVYDVRSTPTSPHTDRPARYLSDAPTALTPSMGGWWVPPQALLSPTFVEDWLPTLTLAREALVVLDLPPRGEERALEVLRQLRQGAMPRRPPGDACGETWGLS